MAHVTKQCTLFCDLIIGAALRACLVSQALTAKKVVAAKLKTVFARTATTAIAVATVAVLGPNPIPYGNHHMVIITYNASTMQSSC